MDSPEKLFPTPVDPTGAVRIVADVPTESVSGPSRVPARPHEAPAPPTRLTPFRDRTRKKLLYVVHKHPALEPGGAQQYALELYEAMRASPDFEPILLAGAESDEISPHLGTPIKLAGGDPNQYYFAVGPDHFDWFKLTARDKAPVTQYFRQFLREVQPDVVHFQHTAGLGLDMLREVRNTVPHAPVLYTLHEFLPICLRQGQMLRTFDDSLCDEASPGRCHECFPQIPPQDFFMRRSLIQSHLSLVDMFLAPSHFLRERYIRWGIPSEKIQYVENGRLPVSTIADSSADRPRRRLGFFGQLNPYKGVLVLLDAMRLLEPRRLRDVANALLRVLPISHPSTAGACQPTRRCNVQLRLHGTNLHLQSEEFFEDFERKLADTRRHVTFAGEYQMHELAHLMAEIDWVIVPSIWWENAPLVIQEAFLYGRPVICSDIGGMAEKVQHGVNGLHFRVNDPVSLADTICYAVETPDLWNVLHEGIPEVHRMVDHVELLSDLYCSLVNERAARA